MIAEWCKRSFLLLLLLVACFFHTIRFFVVTVVDYGNRRYEAFFCFVFLLSFSRILLFIVSVYCFLYVVRGVSMEAVSLVGWLVGFVGRFRWLMTTAMTAMRNDGNDIPCLSSFFECVCFFFWAWWQGVTWTHVCFEYGFFFFFPHFLSTLSTFGGG